MSELGSGTGEGSGEGAGVVSVSEILPSRAIGGRPFGVPFDRNERVSTVCVATKSIDTEFQPVKTPFDPLDEFLRVNVYVF